MYPGSSSVDDFEENNKALSQKKKIVMLAKIDLFAECLMQAVGSRFQGHDIVCFSDPDNLLDGSLVDVTLIMLYRMPAKSFPAILRTIHEFHPKTSIGLVVENADELDPSIAGFVEERLIHGVLPLNLNLDVCLAAIDLLMKGASTSPPPCCGGFRPSPSLRAASMAGGQSCPGRARGRSAQARCRARRIDDPRSSDPRSDLQGNAKQDHRRSSWVVREYRQGSCPQHLQEDERSQPHGSGVALLHQRCSGRARWRHAFVALEELNSEASAKHFIAVPRHDRERS